MYEFLCDYSKQKYNGKAKLRYIDTDSFIVYVKIEDICEDIPKGAEKIFYTSNYELERRHPKEKNKKVITLMKYGLGEKLMKEFVELRAKTYSYLTGDNDESENAKGTKNVL